MRILKIFSRNNNFQYHQQKNFFTNNLNTIKPLATLEVDTVSFSGKNNDLTAKIKALPQSSFPSTNFMEFVYSEIEKNGKINISSLQKQYYSRLLECQTLEEAKEIYPEFEKVIDLSEVSKEEFGVRNFKKIVNGEIEGLNIDNTSLEFLKTYYAKALSLSSANTEEYYGLSKISLNKIFKALNMIMDKEYSEILGAQNFIDNTSKYWLDPVKKEEARARAKNSWQNEETRKKMQESIAKAMAQPEVKEKKSQAAKKQWQEEGYREKVTSSIKEAWNNEEYRKRITEKNKETWQNKDLRKNISQKAKQRWQDEEYRKKNCDAAKKRWENPEYREKITSCTKERWQNKDYQKLMQIVYEARILAWEIHPIAKEATREIQQEYPGVSKLFNKKNKGIKLSENENILLLGYYKKFHEKYPNLMSEIGKLQKEILTKSGFYDKNKNLNDIIDSMLQLQEQTMPLDN